MKRCDIDLDNVKQTAVLIVDPVHPEAVLIQQAATVLKNGGLVAFPTETVYGLGANALDDRAVQSIFVAKARPAYDPLIVHLAGCERLPDVVADVPALVYELADHFWPGPLTLVLPRHERVPPTVTAGGPTVAVRVPAHPVALALIRAADVPVAAPSANRFGRLSPTQAAHVLDDLDGRIDLVLDGGATPVGVESTVLSLATPVPMILRPGGVSREALEAVLGEVDVLARSFASDEVVPSPGTLTKHYAPRARLMLYRGSREAVLLAMRQAALDLIDCGERVGVLITDEDISAFSSTSAILQPVGSSGDLAVVAQRLFASLRALDQAGVSVILARDFSVTGLGLAIRDRLVRAAEGRVIEVAE